MNDEAFNEDAYLFPDHDLLGFSNDHLRKVISQNLKQAHDQTDGSDFNSDVKIDYAQDIIEQSRDILLGRGETFSDDEKQSMRFLEWPLTDEEKAQEALKRERELVAHQQEMERWDRIKQKYTPWLEMLIRGEMPPPEAEFSGVRVHMGVSNLYSGETSKPSWSEVMRMKEEFERISGIEIEAGYSGLLAVQEADQSCFWTFYFEPPMVVEAWSLLQKWWAEGRYTHEPELWVNGVHWTLDCWPRWGTDVRDRLNKWNLKMSEDKFKITMNKSKATAPLDSVTVFADDYDNANYAAEAFYKLDPASRVTVTRNGEEILATRILSDSRNKYMVQILAILVSVTILFSAYTVRYVRIEDTIWPFYVSLGCLLATACYAIFSNVSLKEPSSIGRSST